MSPIDAHPHALVGLALGSMAANHYGSDAELFAAVIRAWVGWAHEMHCPSCTRRVIETVQAEPPAREGRRRRR
jgi:hypothetical protein